MQTQRISLEPVADTSSVVRSSIGGHPVLPRGQGWPVCAQCGERMVFFFQLEFGAGSPPPARAGERLLAFMCPNHNDIPLLAPVKPGEQLPDRYWEKGGHYHLALHPSGEDVLELEPNLVFSALRLETTEDEVKEVGGKTGRPFQIGAQWFKVGGVPSWAQTPAAYRCSCGGELQFLAQVPENFAFPKAEAAPQQPGTYSKKKYLLFLGNEIYLFACPNRCDPRAVWAVVQN